VQQVITRPLWELYPPADPRSFRDTFSGAYVLQAYDRGAAYFIACDLPYLLNFVALVVLINYVLGMLLRPTVQVYVLSGVLYVCLWLIVSSWRVISAYEQVMLFQAWRRDQIDRAWAWIVRK